MYFPYRGSYYDRRSLARAALRRLERYLRDAPHVDAGGGQDRARADAADQSLVGGRAAPDAARPRDGAPAARTPILYDRVRFHRSPPANRDERRRSDDVAAGADVGRRFLPRRDARARRSRAAGEDL